MGTMKTELTNIEKENKRIKMRIVFFTLMLLFILGFIFFNSMQDAKASVANSRSFSKSFQAVLDPNKNMRIDYFHAYVRKAAHVAEFAALGVSVGGIFYNLYLKNGKKYISLSLLISLSVGVIDEFIQSFNTRLGTVSDILIDFSGAILGLLVVFLSVSLINKIKRKRENKYRELK